LTKSSKRRGGGHQEARRPMLSNNLDAAEAGYRVGYDNASHFNRKYKRHLGETAMRDVEQLRELAGSAGVQ
jgi:AraC-like DNA-binding protein